MAQEDPEVLLQEIRALVRFPRGCRVGQEDPEVRLQQVRALGRFPRAFRGDHDGFSF